MYIQEYSVEKKYTKINFYDIKKNFIICFDVIYFNY